MRTWYVHESDPRLPRTILPEVPPATHGAGVAEELDHARQGAAHVDRAGHEIAGRGRERVVVDVPGTDVVLNGGT
jgi:hypothetical protein